MSRFTKFATLSRWALNCPSYYLIRVVSKPGSPAEVRFHKRRRVVNLAAATHDSPQIVESLLREADTNENIEAIEAEVQRLPYAGIFRGGPELYTILRCSRPRIVVETGVGLGYSSSYILEALEQNKVGRLTSIDLPNADLNWKIPMGREPGFLVREGLRHRWNLVLGRTQEVLPSTLRGLGEVDVFFHDSEHTYETMKFEYDEAFRVLTSGGLLLSDDAMWNTALLDFVRVHRLPIRYIYHRGGSAPFTLVRKPRTDSITVDLSSTHGP